jgi:flagellin
MALSVATNTGALMAQAAASSVNRDMETSMERLSTGKRINSASDDAAGVAIASRLESEVRGTDQAIRNAMDAQAMIDTAEGAQIEVVNLLQRMRELAVQAINDTNSTADRTALNTEYQALEAEIDRIGDVTTWAGTKLMDAASTTFTFQVGSRVASADTISVAILEINQTAIGDAKTDISAGSLSTATLASDTVALMDTAIASVNKQRGKIGAVSNRLDSTVANLTNIGANLSAGKGRIEDADFAAETTNLAKTQILQQASTAMLAQANASKQNVLSLLQG